VPDMAVSICSGSRMSHSMSHGVAMSHIKTVRPAAFWAAAMAAPMPDAPQTTTLALVMARSRRERMS